LWDFDVRNDADKLEPVDHVVARLTAGYGPLAPVPFGIWKFSKNKSAAKDLIEWLGQREQTEKLVTAARGYDIPPFLSMTDFKIWESEGPPNGTLSNYPIKPAHKSQAVIFGMPAPPALALQIGGAAIMPKMIARVAQERQPIEQVIAWAEKEMEGFRR
jgi:ABC-type glycerol-3-phosphate transport system substrate-binding protein